jgi:hypothetical protein
MARWQDQVNIVRLGKPGLAEDELAAAWSGRSGCLVDARSAGGGVSTASLSVTRYEI